MPTNPVDHGELVAALARLARAATGDFSVDSMLVELCATAAQTLEVDSVGVMGIFEAEKEPHRGRFVHADATSVQVEMLQEALAQGPCREAIESGHPVVVADLGTQHGRWGALVDAALEAQLQAVVALPLRSRGRSWGSLDLYRRQAGTWDEATMSAASLLADVAVSYLVMAHDRDEAKASRRELEQRALHDQLTGLPNRGLLYDHLENALVTARRRQSTIAVMFIDLDRFKEINDTFGHGAGDRVLLEVTRRMSSTLRAGDTLARLAGDEFVLLCEDLPNEVESLHHILRVVTSRLRAVMAQPVAIDGVDVVISASIGVTTTRDAPDAETLLHDADTAMYAAKAAGRSRVVIRDHAFGTAFSYGHQLERDLVCALNRGQLILHYQPIIDARTGAIDAVEALLRWSHPEHGLLPAHDFIERAEDTGALPSIGRWVIDTACTQLAAWRRQLGDRAPRRVFCNLRPQELSDPETLATITASLRAHDLEASDLGLEILEDAFTDPLLLPVLNDYYALGHPMSIDDFGTGYSSLSRLVSLPVAYAKIDRSFVAGLPGDARSRALIDAVLVVATNLDLRVIGEGVETEAQRNHLATAGVHLLQGYHLGQPQPAEHISALLAR
ncbi:MAG: putative bifunctional diguanylate cyclase/phosphodiesterase [Janthinobacterium lividum]